MHKKFYRTIEHLLRSIDASAGDEAMLRAIVGELVSSEDAHFYGIASGRLYRERSRDFLLIASVGEYGDEIEGKSISKDYAVIRHLIDRRLWYTLPESPGYDPDLEAQFTSHNSAAILVGQNPSYIISLSLPIADVTREELLVMLESIRAVIGLKLRQGVLENQLRQAQSIQASLLPAVLPELSGFSIAAISLPADEVGGDVYDAKIVEEGMLGLMIADASGHGLPAALQARDAVVGLRMGQAQNEKITSLVQRLNYVIHETTLASRFISLFYAEVETNGHVTYVNAGHCQPLLITPTGEVFELQTCGPVLGPLPEAQFRRRSMTLRPGEVLVLFTDGLSERVAPGEDAREGAVPDEFGRSNLIRVCLENRDRPVAEIVDALVQAGLEFGGEMPLGDDLTVVVVKRNPEASRTEEAMAAVPAEDQGTAGEDAGDRR